MRVLCLVQARMASERLYGKVLHDICGRPMLEHILRSLSHSKTISKTVVATTTSGVDDKLADFLKKNRHGYFRGSEDDVLLRFIDASRAHPSDYIVRITADNPLTDPSVVDSVVGLAASTGCDYASNHLTPTFPLGFVVEVVSAKTLLEVEGITSDPADREHVTWFIYRNRGRFHTENFPAPPGLEHPDWRLTVDTAEDMRLVREIFGSLYRSEGHIKYRDVVNLLLRRPDLLKINSDVRQRHPSGA